MNIIINPEYKELIKEEKSLREELTSFIAIQDELVYHTCPNIEARYMEAVGMLETKILEFKIDIRAIKRKTELIRAKLNRREVVILTEIDNVIEKEYKEYYKQVQKALKEAEKSIERLSGEFLSEQDTIELKKAYKNIVKRLHPDLNPECDENDIMLFHKAVSAYENGDLEAIKLIEILIDKVSERNNTTTGIEAIRKRCEKLKDNIRVVNERILKIKTSFPYNQLDFINNKVWVEDKREELKAVIETLKEIYKAYEDEINTMLGGQ